jgi:hypothetical membrane protein
VAGPLVLASAWLAQPLYVVVELAAALTTGVGYSLGDDTISDLGAACEEPGASGCSSSPWLLNTAFVVFGVLQALGALWLLRSARGRRRSHAVGVVGLLWAVAGVGSVGVGLLPVDQHPGAHAVAALPVFVCQPLALLLHARLVRGVGLRVVGALLGTAALAGAVAFGVALGADHGAGLVERLAIWPAKIWLALVVLGYTAAPEAPEPPVAA